MKVRKILVVYLSVLLFTVAGCNTPGEEKVASSNVSSSSTPQLSSSSSVSTTAPSDETSTSKKEVLESTPSKSETKKPQNDSEWIVYSNSKDSYKLHKKKKDGSEDEIILNESVVKPCLANGWVYYFPDLSEIDKVKLDGSQKTKVCDVDAMDALNANSAVTAEYKNESILYKLVQLREIGDNSPNTVTYYKLDLNRNKITEITDQFSSEIKNIQK